MAILMVIFGISIAIATFIENDFGSSTARSLIYNSIWFDILLSLGILNILLVSVKHKTYKKPTVFLFHIAFILIILGAGITRFFGFEGSMHIREGKETNVVTTSKSYITIQVQLNENYKSLAKPVILSSLTKNHFNKTLQVGDKQVTIKLVKYYPAAIPSFVAEKAGIPILELVYQGGNTVILKQGERKKVGSVMVSFDSPESTMNDFRITMKDNLLYFKVPYDVSMTSMMDQSVQVAKQDSLHRFNSGLLYNVHNNLMVLRNYLPSGRVVPMKVEKNSDTPSSEALVFDITCDSVSKEVTYWGKKDELGDDLLVDINDIIVNINYGVKIAELPFGIKLDDFIFERYPGSNSPSWYESKVSVIDGTKTLPEFRIYMNHILKYKGYRFYQSSYDEDENGTILSVNQDSAGTGLTYSGYLLMAISMILSLLSKRSRFRFLLQESNRIRVEKKALLAISILFVSLFLSSNTRAGELPKINPDHAHLFGSIMTQGHDGRIKPVNTLSSEILRKIARQETYKGMSSDEVLLSILAFPEFWEDEPIIKVGHKQINDILGMKGKLLPFTAFFSPGQDKYKLLTYVNDANSKKPAYRSKFDNELIRADERLNVFYMAYSGTLLTIFPRPDDPNEKWYSPTDADNLFPPEDSVFVNNILPYYLSTVREATKTDDWKKADQLVNAIKSFQEKYGEKVYPSEFRIKLELLDNRLALLEHLSSVYGLIGFFLLILQFIGIFYIRFNLRIPTLFATIIILLVFAAHTFALASRWYVSGHAPWSNGYEALTYIAWATMLAGIIFSSKSPITLSTTAILASLILMTAHLSWMDPEITNLVPVLKSYWLVIHVAVITSSYGFLGLGALLALSNLIIIFLETRSNKKYIDLIIHEISNIIEMTLIAGLFLLTIGTFLGGVWANESWGRYWGWDPKETWALVTIMVYAFIAHMRLVPGLRSLFGFNLAALLGFGSVIMTYFGVNFYLSGLHSYAKGDPLPVPDIVYYTIISIAIIAIMAYINHYRLNKPAKNVLTD